MMRFALIALAFALVAATVARVRVVEHWALYAASGPRAPYHLFLDPFPDAKTCQVESAQIRRGGGQAYCAGHLALSLDPQKESAFFWQFFGPANPLSGLCGRP